MKVGRTQLSVLGVSFLNFIERGSRTLPESVDVRRCVCQSFMTFVFIGNPQGQGQRGGGRPGEGGAGRGLWRVYYRPIVYIYKYIYKYINI